MKRLLILITVFILSLLACLSFVSCEKEEEEKSITCPDNEHVYDNWRVEKEALCNAKGLKKRTCIKCPFYQTMNYSDKNNHEIVDGACTRCDYKTGPQGVDFVFVEDGSNSFFILNKVPETDSKEYVIPAYIDHENGNKYPVREIAAGAFENCLDMESIVVPNSVQKINCGAFKGLISLKEITLPFVGESKSQENASFGFIFGTEDYGNTVITNQPVGGVPKTFYIPASLSKVTLTGGFFYESCFANCTRIKTIDYQGDEAKRVYDKAFNNCIGLEYITFSDSVVRFGNRAFENCISLRTIPLHDNFETIGDFCFSGCNFDYFELPESLLEIGDYVFNGCNNLVNITIPSSLRVVPKGMFQYCTNLETVTFENGVTGTGEGAFAGCTNLKTLNFSDTFEEIGEICFKDCTSLKEVTISAITVGQGAFQNCTSLEKVELVYGIETLSDYTFSNCSSLNEISLPATLKELGSNVFVECVSLSSILVDEGNINYSQIDGHIYSKDGSTLILYSPGNDQESFVIPEEVTTILSGAFDNAKFLKEVVFPSTMKEITEGLFLQNKTIQSIVINEGVETIGKKAFAGSSIKSVTIKNVKNIGEQAFSECASLKSVIIDGVETIGKGAFDQCPALTDVTLTNVNKVGENAFAEDIALVNLTIGEGVVLIDTEAFAKCSSLKSVVLSDSVTYLGKFAFSHCVNLTTFTINEGLQKIDNLCFLNCPKIEEFYIPSTLTSVNSTAFEGCNSLKKFVVSDMNETFITYDDHLAKGTVLVAFCYGQMEENQILIPDGITEISAYLFRNFTPLKYVFLPESLKIIGNEAFSSTSLLEIDLSGIETIGEYAFSGCKLLKSITIPSSVTTVSDYAFHDCTFLNFIYIASSVVNMGEGAFWKCAEGGYIYIEFDEIPEEWDERWNESKLNVVTGYEFQS